MTHDAPTTTVGRRLHVYRTEAERQALMAEYELWDGTQISFCEAKGVAPRTLMGWFSKRGITSGAAKSRSAAATMSAASKPDSFIEIAAEAGPGWDVELSLGDGVTLRLRRP